MSPRGSQHSSCKARRTVSGACLSLEIEVKQRQMSPLIHQPLNKAMQVNNAVEDVGGVARQRPLTKAVGTLTLDWRPGMAAGWRHPTRICNQTSWSPVAWGCVHVHVAATPALHQCDGTDHPASDPGDLRLELQQSKLFHHIGIISGSRRLQLVVGWPSHQAQGQSHQPCDTATAQFT